MYQVFGGGGGRGTLCTNNNKADFHTGPSRSAGWATMCYIRVGGWRALETKKTKIITARLVFHVGAKMTHDLSQRCQRAQAHNHRPIDPQSVSKPSMMLRLQCTNFKRSRLYKSSEKNLGELLRKARHQTWIVTRRQRQKYLRFKGSNAVIEEWSCLLKRCHPAAGFVCTAFRLIESIFFCGKFICLAFPATTVEAVNKC